LEQLTATVDEKMKSQIKERFEYFLSHLPTLHVYIIPTKQYGNGVIAVVEQKNNKGCVDCAVCVGYHYAGGGSD